jgi:hypothetical protein
MTARDRRPTWLTVGLAPDWSGPWPDRSAPTCHDGTGYLEVSCPCGTSMHVHRSQLAGLPSDGAVLTPCTGCPRLLGMVVGELRAGLDAMWDH